MNGFFSSDFVKITMPLVAAAIAWAVNQREKRRWEDYIRRERHYEALVRAASGFYIGQESAAAKASFLEHLRVCWLYAPDTVIRAAYEFIDTVEAGAGTDDHAKDRAFGELVVAIRQDLIAREPLDKTSLRAQDSRHLAVTP